MGYVSARDGRRVVARLRRNGAALIMAGGRLPDGHCWIESLVPEFGHSEPGEWRWEVVCEGGPVNIGSRWPLRLIFNADDLYFRNDGKGRVSVELTP